MLLAGGARSLAADAAAQPPPAPTLAPAPKQSPARLPKLGGQGPTTRVKGKIVRSSRGRKGPVRLLLERPDGEKVTVLVAPDEFCDRAGLSLRAEETVEIEGSMLKAQRPILIATAVVADGRTVPIRDAKGKLVPLPGTGEKGVSRDATASGGGSASGTASVGGGASSEPAGD